MICGDRFEKYLGLYIEYYPDRKYYLVKDIRIVEMLLSEKNKIRKEKAPFHKEEGPFI